MNQFFVSFWDNKFNNLIDCEERESFPQVGDRISLGDGGFWLVEDVSENPWTPNGTYKLIGVRAIDDEVAA